MTPSQHMDAYRQHSTKATEAYETWRQADLRGVHLQGAWHAYHKQARLADEHWAKAHKTPDAAGR